EHRPAEVVEPLEVVIAAVVYPVTVGPFVVPWDVDHRGAESVEPIDRLAEDVVGAEGAATLDVAVEHRKRDLGSVDVRRERCNLRNLIGAVRSVTPQSECEPGLIATFVLLADGIEAEGGGQRDRDAQAENRKTSRVPHDASSCDLVGWLEEARTEVTW